MLCFQELVQKFPGTVPGNVFCHVPRWPYSSRTADGTCLSKKYELEIMNECGGLKVLSNGLPLMIVIPDNERSGNNPTQKNQKQGNHANALVLLQMHPSQDRKRGRET